MAGHLCRAGDQPGAGDHVLLERDQQWRAGQLGLVPGGQVVALRGQLPGDLPDDGARRADAGQAQSAAGRHAGRDSCRLGDDSGQFHDDAAGLRAGLRRADRCGHRFRLCGGDSASDQVVSGRQNRHDRRYRGLRLRLGARLCRSAHELADRQLRVGQRGHDSGGGVPPGRGGIGPDPQAAAGGLHSAGHAAPTGGQCPGEHRLFSRADARHLAVLRALVHVRLRRRAPG